MAKNKEQEQQPKRLIPEITISEDIIQDPDFHVKGNYLIEHVPTGVLQSVTPRTYAKVFEGNKDFIVKKNQNQ